MEEMLEEMISGLRNNINLAGTATKGLMSHSDFEKPEHRVGQQGEMKANVMLAFHHLEDARMRLGKVLQAASDDGVSMYDK